MKKILFTICFIGLFATAQAQLSITPRAGLSMPQGMLDNVAGNGFSYGLDLDYAINDNFRVGASFSQHRFNDEIAGFSFNVIDFSITPITASVKYVLPGTKLRPYIGLEGGLYNFKVGAAGFNITREYWGLAPSLGVLYPVNERIDFFANAQYHIMYINETIPIADFQINQDIKFIPVNLGFSFKF
ncbi:outer membrane beta-barrel protein [Catalinimonas sp. 4WD22]|uniref:outer membrane beta-barrel protein n=1 Tax=Catalinimonas locisalis TaxID=3133978 RepID=UPI003101063D